MKESNLLFLVDSLFILRKYVNFLIKDFNLLHPIYTSNEILNKFNNVKVEAFKASVNNEKYNGVSLYRNQILEHLNNANTYKLFLADNLSINSDEITYRNFIDEVFDGIDTEVCVGIPADPIDLILTNFHVNIETYGYIYSINRYIENFINNGNKIHSFYFKLVPYILEKFKNCRVIPIHAGKILDSSKLDILCDFLDIQKLSIEEIGKYKILPEPVDTKFYSFLKSDKFLKLDTSEKYKAISSIKQLQKHYLIETSIYNTYLPQLSDSNIEYLNSFRVQTEKLLNLNNLNKNNLYIQSLQLNPTFKYNFIEA